MERQGAAQAGRAKVKRQTDQSRAAMNTGGKGALDSLVGDSRCECIEGNQLQQRYRHGRPWPCTMINAGLLSTHWGYHAGAPCLGCSGMGPEQQEYGRSDLADTYVHMLQVQQFCQPQSQAAHAASQTHAVLSLCISIANAGQPVTVLVAMSKRVTSSNLQCTFTECLTDMPCAVPWSDKVIQAVHARLRLGHA